ncbi:MAG: indolepyruvate oxidoreductase subunit beta family protein [Proteobacteria bacterium]|nr:indolepyruvate oxidoreductase subunit beta family protein [Pseudomonadota bacterium]
MSTRTVKLTVAALGGQGGGVLTDWLIAIAESCGYLVQSTSVPGVAQRTGATIYYLEFLSQAEAQRAGHEPVMALMPVPGDVDCVVASELAEAGRAIQRGLVSAELTTLIASTHRAYAIAEKSALGRGITDTQALLELVRGQGKRAILFDMEATAERHHAVVSAVLLGAISGAGVLPFPKQSFLKAITDSGLAVTTNLAAFEDAYAQARQEAPAQAAPTPGLPEVPQRAATAALQPLLDRIRALPEGTQRLALEGARRALDYQDPGYAAQYLSHVEAVAAADHAPYELTGAVARGLALWMTFEDPLRVAQLKTRAVRTPRVRAEVRATEHQIVQVTEFMRPRVEEIAGTLPAPAGRRLLASPGLRAWVGRFTGGRQVRSSSVGGFLLLYVLGGLRRYRRATLRYQEEHARITAWLARVATLARTDYALAVELARAQRLIKGYGDTHERGWRNFCALLGEIEALAGRSDGAQTLQRLQEAALADEEGAALARELAALHARAAA